MSVQRSFNYTVSECDVEDKAALQRFRDKRLVWENWLDGDPDHAIWANISQLVWREVAFGTLSHIADSQKTTALHNTLISEAVLYGHVALQTMSIRRLADLSNGSFSIPRLANDIRKNISLFTRENYVCYDGLPYDYQAVMEAEFADLREVVVRWGHTTGPKAWASSQHAHAAFDKLSGITPKNRQRNDRLSPKLLDTIDSWIESSEAKSIQSWTHNYLAHASSMESRTKRADFALTGKKIGEAIRGLARTTEAISAHILYAGGRRNALMPVPQYDVFEFLDNPALSPSNMKGIQAYWDQISDSFEISLNTVANELPAQ